MIIETEKIPWLIETFVLLCVPICVHIVTVALAARFLGIPVRKVSFGIGPTLWERGRLRLGWFPLGALRGNRPAQWEEHLPQLTILPMLMLFGSWLLAIGVFISRS